MKHKIGTILKFLSWIIGMMILATAIIFQSYMEISNSHDAIYYRSRKRAEREIDKRYSPETYFIFGYLFGIGG